MGGRCGASVLCQLEQAPHLWVWWRSRHATDISHCLLQIDAKKSVPQEMKPKARKVFVGGLSPETTEGAFLGKCPPTQSRGALTSKPSGVQT
jgi:hypothetical protein